MRQRIELLDVLRGFAILGTNIWLFANAGNLETLFGLAHPYATGLKNVLQQTTLVFTNGKSLGILTILFGVELELQFRSAARRGSSVLPVYLFAPIQAVGYIGLIAFIVRRGWISRAT